MSRVPASPPLISPTGRATAAAPVIVGPIWLDFFLLMLGCGVSLFLAQLSGLDATRGPETHAAAIDPVLRILPSLLFLPLGPILLWPFFYSTQIVLGRTQPLTAAEWLLGFAWLAAMLLTVWLAIHFWGKLPESLQDLPVQSYLVVGYMVGFLSLGAISLLILLVSLFGRGAFPWTHRLSIALLSWPLVPLALVFFWKIRIG